jgi:hypothetical protein
LAYGLRQVCACSNLRCDEGDELPPVTQGNERLEGAVMLGFLRLLLAFTCGAIIALGLGWVWLGHNGKLVRPQNGMVLGGYLLPGGFERLRVEGTQDGIDNTIYTIRVDDCPSLTIWDVSVSGSATGSDDVEFFGAEDGLLMRYQTSQPVDFLNAGSLQYFTSVRLDPAEPSACVVTALEEVFEYARPVYARIDAFEQG